MQELSANRRFPDDAYNRQGVLRKRIYERELRRLQIELVKLQRSIAERGERVVVIFEGRDAAGKGGVIRRLTEQTNPRIVRTVALGKPSDRERTQWYFQRFIAHLPAAGEMVLFDRSWYNRAGVERVMGFASEAEVAHFMKSCPHFEALLVDEGIHLIKYWFSISAREQERRLQARVRDPVKRWKVSPMDLAARERWAEYSYAKDDMLRHTHTAHAPWHFVDADVKRHARLNCIADLLARLPYSDEPPAAPELPPRRDLGIAEPRDASLPEAWIERLY